MADHSTQFVHALVDRVRRGDRAAFDELMGRYRDRLLSVIRMRFGAELRQKAEIDDVLQETLLRAYRSLGNFRWEGHAPFIAWLTTIAERTTADFVRRVSSRRYPEGTPVSLSQPVATPGSATGPAKLGDVLAGQATEPMDRLRRRERLSRLEEALEHLSPDHREVIVLSVLQCLPTREVGERMGISSGAVCMLRTRALMKLRQIFGDTESLRLPARTLAPDVGRNADPEDPRGSP